MGRITLLLYIGLMAACARPIQDMGGCDSSYLPYEVSSVTVSNPYTLYSQGSYQAQVACILAPDRAELGYYRVLYSVRLIGVQAGDILSASADAELTNETPSPMLAVSYISLGESQYDTGTPISTVNGYNITHGMHHGVVRNTAIYQFSENHSEIFVNFVAYAASGEPELINEWLRVESHPLNQYGRIDLLIFR